AGVARHGGVLALGGDDPLSKSSTLPSHSEVAFYDALFPVLFPGNIQEILDLGRLGFELSRYTGLWVGFKIVTNVADEVGTAEVAPDRVVIADPGFEYDGRPWQQRQNPLLMPPWGLDTEEKRAFCELFIRDILYNEAERPRVLGKSDLDGRPLVPADAELDADRIAQIVATRLERRIPHEAITARVALLQALRERPAPLTL